MSNFRKYSVFYDLLYRDKNYDAEAEYVARTIRESVPFARDILELGSGTGRHGRLLAAAGFSVFGIERSQEMVAIANAAPPCEGTGSFTCEVGDICAVKLNRTFDAVIALFHVISYQTTNQALQQAFRAVSDHLKPKGIFLFDVWHGPAVLTEKPRRRVKEVADERYRVKRIAYPELDSGKSTVKVVYQMDCHDRETGQDTRFDEEHLMRYLFPTEIDFLAAGSGLRRMRTEEFVTGEMASTSTWGVAYVLQK
jgi:SAM-dependent methyltransferase